jgi:hypothetical protein
MEPKLFPLVKNVGHFINFAHDEFKKSEKKSIGDLFRNYFEKYPDEKLKSVFESKSIPRREFFHRMNKILERFFEKFGKEKKYEIFLKKIKNMPFRSNMKGMRQLVEYVENEMKKLNASFVKNNKSIFTIFMILLKNLEWELEIQEREIEEEREKLELEIKESTTELQELTNK